MTTATISPGPEGWDRNEPPDWVFGGQSDTYADTPSRWRSRSYGFHAEAGSIFSYVTGQSRILTRNDTPMSIRCIVARAPALGMAQRVNFSMNSKIDRNVPCRGQEHGAQRSENKRRRHAHSKTVADQ